MQPIQNVDDKTFRTIYEVYDTDILVWGFLEVKTPCLVRVNHENKSVEEKAFWII